MNAFARGLGVFWRTELRLVLQGLAMIVIGAVMAAAIILTFVGVFYGFWLFHTPVRTPWSTVWVFRGSAVLVLMLIGYVLVRHITRLGRETDNAE